MKVLLVIHGYPPRYNAGSEVYTQSVAHELAVRGHKVKVFTREEDSFLPDYHISIEKDPLSSDIEQWIVNLPRSRFRGDRYRHKEMDKIFAELIDDFQPDIVYINHLCHLSTSIIDPISRRSLPILFMLHDYWLLCPRGQFLQMVPPASRELWPLCSGPEVQKCALNCYVPRNASGNPDKHHEDVKYWTRWMEDRQHESRDIFEKVDLFLAPSHHLKERFEQATSLLRGKLQYLPYGFHLERLRGRKQISFSKAFAFGYIGRYVSAKGVDLLIRAFSLLVEKGKKTELHLWGRENGEYSKSLKRLIQSLSQKVQKGIFFHGEYSNQNIVDRVFNKMNAIVVPSVWEENSPLVIHEGLEAGLPVITVDLGGMKELVDHEVNGLLFQPRNVEDLAQQMTRFVENPNWAEELGKKGYLFSENGHIPSIQEHVNSLETWMEKLVQHRRTLQVKKFPGPWRITFDTNPDTCNLNCIMCEDHSTHSPKRANRLALKTPHRVMPVEWIEKVVREALPHGLREIIPSTMGEPLLYKDFERILGICQKYDLKLNLTTNGTFPRLGPLQWGELIAPVGSDVKISINGATARTQESIMLGTSFEKILENVSQFIQVRDQVSKAGINHCRLTFQVTFMTLNGQELPELVRLASKLGVERLKGHHLWINFGEVENLSFRNSPAKIQKWNEIVKAIHHATEKYPLPGGKKIILENIDPIEENESEASFLPKTCPFLGREIWLSAEGKWSPCCAPDDERATLGDFGNIGQTSVMNLWQSKAYRELLDSYPGRSLCRNCNMRRPIQ